MGVSDLFVSLDIFIGYTQIFLSLILQKFFFHFFFWKRILFTFESDSKSSSLTIIFWSFLSIFTNFMMFCFWTPISSLQSKILQVKKYKKPKKSQRLNLSGGENRFFSQKWGSFSQRKHDIEYVQNCLLCSRTRKRISKSEKKLKTRILLRYHNQSKYKMIHTRHMMISLYTNNSILYSCLWKK